MAYFPAIWHRPPTQQGPGRTKVPSPRGRHSLSEIQQKVSGCTPSSLSLSLLLTALLCPCPAPQLWAGDKPHCAGAGHGHVVWQRQSLCAPCQISPADTTAQAMALNPCLMTQPFWMLLEIIFCPAARFNGMCS